MGLCLYVSVSVCGCVCVWGEGRGGKGVGVVTKQALKSTRQLCLHKCLQE